MSAPLPPELANLERVLETTRAPLPAALRARVLAAAARAVPAPLDPALPLGWFAASVAIAAAVLLNLSNSAALSAPEPRVDEPVYRCALARVRGEGPQSCFEAAAGRQEGASWNSR